MYNILGQVDINLKCFEDFILEEFCGVGEKQILREFLNQMFKGDNGMKRDVFIFKR